MRQSENHTNLIIIIFNDQLFRNNHKSGFIAFIVLNVGL